MLRFIGGDILQTEAEYIAQGVAVGAQEGLGTGLALKISKRWPEAQRAFKRHTHRQRFAGGDLFAVAPGPGQPGIIYLATQPDLYRATLPFLNRALRALARHCAARAIASVALPKIGAGLGKLDWEGEVKPLLRQHLADSPTLFLIYEDFTLEYERAE